MDAPLLWGTAWPVRATRIYLAKHAYYINDACRAWLPQ